MDIPKDRNANLRYRLNIFKEAENDPKLQAMLIRQCEVDPIFFINSFAWTYDPRLTDHNDIPFILYDYQNKFILDQINCIETGQDSITEKSRDMGFSWMIVAMQVWAWRFKQWASLYGSYKESYVDQQGNMDSHFERLRYTIKRLPQWMLPSDYFEKYMSIQGGGAEISGDSGKNFGTGGRRKFVVLDEFALWENDMKAFRKTRDITPCRIIGATPEGRYNVYGRIMTDHRDYQHLSIKKNRLHWSLHPLKTQEWYEEQKLKSTPLDIAKELDISYDESVTGAVYKDFKERINVGDYQFDPKLPLYTSWDYGRDMTAIIWWQKNFKTDSLYIVDAYQKSDQDIEFFAAFVTGVPTAGFSYDDEEMEMIQKHAAWKSKYMGHIGDPYNGDSQSVVTRNTVATQLAKYGINLILQFTYVAGRGSSHVQERIRKVHLALPRFFINRNLVDYMSCMMQARYPKTREGSEYVKEKYLPIHDGTSHFRTSTEYFIDNEPKGYQLDVEEEIVRDFDRHAII